MTHVAHVSFDLVFAPLLVAAGLLLVAGIAKVRQPHAAQRVLEAIGLPTSIRTVQLLGLIEAALGAAAIVSGVRWLAVAVMAMFVVFAAVATWLLIGGADLPSCGCLGALETPPSIIHVVLSALGAVAAGAAALADPVRVDQQLSSLPMLGIPLLIAAAAAVAAAALAMAYVPLLASSYAAGPRG